MATPRALIAVLLLGLAVPIGLAGLALPVYAQDDGGDDAGDQTGNDDSAPAAADNPAELPVTDEAMVCVEGQPCPEGCETGKPCPQLNLDFGKLDVGGSNSQQNIAVIQRGRGGL